MDLAVYDLTDQEKAWQKRGVLDDRGLVKFDTLHNMQVRSCEVFAPKPLFATYDGPTKQFQWMTFAECESAKRERFCCCVCVLCGGINSYLLMRLC